MVTVLAVLSGLLSAPDLEHDVLAAARQLDECVAAGWQEDSPPVQPAAVCDDAAFLRRVWLDLAGRVPPRTEAEKLARSGQPLDRVALVEALLSSREFEAYWSRQWAEYLLGQRPFDQAEFSGRHLQRFLRESLASQRSYDQIVSDLICAEGAMDESGAVNFLLRYDADPAPLAGAVSQKFLGLTLQCAECHDHPHAAWKQSDFEGLSAFFARVRRMDPANPQPNEEFVALLERPRGELLIADKTGTPDDEGNYPTRTVLPRYPGAEHCETGPARRQRLGAWLAAPENPYFARHYVNRVWTQLMGAPLVLSFDPASDGAASTTESRSSNAAILEHLRAAFVASRYDIRRLIAVIVLSDAYQRGSGAPADAPADAQRLRREQELFARCRARPLSADQLHLSLGQAFGFYYDDDDHRLAQLTAEEYTYDVPVESFGEESQSLGRALALFNGDHAREAVSIAAQSLAHLHGDAAGAAHIEHVFLSLLSRVPTAAELESMLILAGSDSPQRGLEDAVWVILNSAEFQTNH